MKHSHHPREHDLKKNTIPDAHLLLRLVTLRLSVTLFVFVIAYPRPTGLAVFRSAELNSTMSATVGLNKENLCSSHGTTHLFDIRIRVVFDLVHVLGFDIHLFRLR